MILLEAILQLHEISIKKYGGSPGVREIDGLESAIARPFQIFGGEDLYPTIFEKATALAENIIINHPFIDGKKRTGFYGMVALLKAENYVLTATQQDAYDFTIRISIGEIGVELIAVWLKENTK